MNSKLVVVEDPRLNIPMDESRLVVVNKGGQRTENVSEPSVNYGQTSAMTNAQWSIRSPNNQCVLDRNVFVKWYLEVKTNEELVLDTYDCLRSHPVSSVVESLNVKINGSGQTSKRLGNLIHLEENFMAKPEMRRCAFMTPSQPDNFGDLFNGNFGFNRNPAAGFGENVNEDSRGSYLPVELNVPDGGLFRTRWEVSEALNLSPFLDLSGHRQEGMTNINDLYINFQFKSLQNKVLSLMPRLDPGAPPDIDVSQIQVRLYQAPELKLSWITPLNLDMVPPVQTLAYVSPDDHYVQSTTQLTNANQIVNVSSETYSLSQVPYMMACGVRLRENDENANEGSAWYNIRSVRVIWNNQGTLLDQSSPEQLYQMCRRNGLTKSYQQWKRSPILLLKFGSDIGLPDGLAPSTVGSFTLKVELTCSPGTVRLSDVPNNRRIGNEGVFVFYQQGTAMIAQNSARISEGLLTSMNVIQAEARAEMSESHSHEAHVDGKGFSDRFAGVVKKAHKRHMAGAAMEEAKPKESRKIGGGLLRK